jgi:hypothetical protein
MIVYYLKKYPSCGWMVAFLQISIESFHEQVAAAVEELTLMLLSTEKVEVIDLVHSVMTLVFEMEVEGEL